MTPDLPRQTAAPADLLYRCAAVIAMEIGHHPDTYTIACPEAKVLGDCGCVSEHPQITHCTCGDLNWPCAQAVSAARAAAVHLGHHLDGSPDEELPSVFAPKTLTRCTQGCSPTWVEGSHDKWGGRPPSCPWCQRNDWRKRAFEISEYQRHRKHRPWVRWKITRRVVSWLYHLGVIGGYRVTQSKYCTGCVHDLIWRPSRRSYILGLHQERWRNIFRNIKNQKTDP